MGEHVGGGDPDLISVRVQAVVHSAPLAHRFRVAPKKVSQCVGSSVSSWSCNQTADGGRRRWTLGSLMWVCDPYSWV